MVYGHYKYFHSYSAGIDFSRQNLTSVHVRFWRPKYIPALLGLKCYINNLKITHLKLCFATAIHNFMWLKIIHICLIRDPNISKSWCLNTHFYFNNCDFNSANPANTIHSPNAVLRLARRLRRRPNINSALGQRIVFAWKRLVQRIQKYYNHAYRCMPTVCEASHILNISCFLANALCLLLWQWTVTCSS